MTALPHPPERLRGQIEGFPRWPASPSLPEGSGSAKEVVDGALSWLRSNLRWFEPAQWERFLPRRPFPCGALAELLVLCRVLHRGRHHGHPLLGQALDLADEQVRGSDFLAGLARVDQTFPYYAYLVALLQDAGRPQPRAVERIQPALRLRCGGHAGAHHPVQHRLELRYILDLGGFIVPPELLSVPELFAASIGAGDPDPLWMSDDQVYALTHAIFYGTDFGRRPLPGRGRLARLCRTLLGVYLAMGDLDLAGELVYCLDLLDPVDPGGTGSAPLTDLTWRVLSGVQRPDGAVPGPLHDSARWAVLTGQQAQAYLFATCFHTTMVAAMAAAEREYRHAR